MLIRFKAVERGARLGVDASGLDEVEWVHYEAITLQSSAISHPILRVSSLFVR